MEIVEPGISLRSALPLLLSATCSTDVCDAPLYPHQVKASFLFNLLRFIDWPAELCTPDGTLNLRICGAYSLGAFFELHGERVHNRTISVQRVQEKEVLKARKKDWHILMMSGDVRITSAPLAMGLLTVGETDGFTERCGALSLFMVDGRVRYQLNDRVMRVCGLSLDPRLLNLRMGSRRALMT